MEPTRSCVLIVVMSLEAQDGVGDQIANLAIELPKYGFHATVIIRNPVDEGQPYVRFLRTNGVTVWAVSTAQSTTAQRIFRAIQFCLWPIVLLDAILRQKTLKASCRSVWGTLRRIGYWGLDIHVFWRLAATRLKCKVAVVHLRKPDAWSVVRWAKACGFRIIYTEDTVPRPNTVHYYRKLSDNMSCIDYITAVSEASSKAIQPYLLNQHNVHVIPNMVVVKNDSDSPKVSANDPLQVAAIARLSPEKSLSTFLKTCAIVHQQDSTIKFTIYGDGAERQQLLDLRKQLRLDSAVSFAGVFEKWQLPEIMAQIDVIVLSSIYEGMPVALLEAMAYGKPVVATAVGGVPEVVVDGVTGILVPARDPDALASAILTLSRDRQLYERMARAARDRHLALFTPERVVPKYVLLYERLAA